MIKYNQINFLAFGTVDNKILRLIMALQLNLKLENNILITDWNHSGYL